MHVNDAHREKLSVIGHMASSIAHDLSNPLATITTSAETLLTFWPGPHPADSPAPNRQLREDLELIRDEARRAADIVHGLLRFARDDAPVRTMVSLHELLHRISRMSRHYLEQAGVTIVVETDLRPGSPSDLLVRGDANRLQQVVMNLIINAQQAIAACGRTGTIWLGVAARPGHLAAVTVSDNGPGVPTELQSTIFAPYWTTKPSGTGLGLAIAASIVSEHGGTLLVEDRAEGGARFTMLLPVAREHTSGAPSIDPDPESFAKAPARTILLVDDESGIRRAITRFLKRLGWDAYTASSGEQALEMLAGRQFDVILSDYWMPEMTGKDFYERIRIEHPELTGRIAFMTGDLMREETREFLEECGCPSLQKPYELSDLLRILEACANGTGTSGVR